MRKQISITVFTVIIIILISAGCSSRNEIPVIAEDNTIIFPAKDPDAISARITFFRNVSKKTGKKIGVGTSFTIREDENVRADIELENCFVKTDRELMFHLDWIDELGRSFYQKRIDLSPADSSTSLNSSVSISPDKRQPGEYCLRVYLFRELIAEKKFELRSASNMTLAQENGISARIILCRNIDRKSGQFVGVDSMFTIRENEKVRAYADITNLSAYNDQEVTLSFDWIDSTGKPFYQKQFELTGTDSSSTINSSISIEPESRSPGEYLVRLYLINDLIAEKKFELRTEPPISNYLKNIKAKLTLYSRLDKKTGELSGVGTVFTIKDKATVRASVDIENLKSLSDRDLLFNFEWVDANGKPFYQKQIDFPAGNSSIDLSSSISIAPDKRQPGFYSLRLYIFNNLLTEQKFELRP